MESAECLGRKKKKKKEIQTIAPHNGKSNCDLILNVFQEKEKR